MSTSCSAVPRARDATWGEAVWAVVSVKSEHSITSGALIDHAGMQVARYNAPKRMLIADDLPKSAAGKILRTECRRLAMESRHLPEAATHRT